MVPMFNRRTILLVEDNEDDVFIMQTAWGKAAVPNPLQVVTDGDEAVSYLGGEDQYADRQKYPLPVVIFLDLNMPRKNGFEVLQWLRREPALKRIVVAILSASSRGEDVARAFDCGANAYLVKPSKVEALIQMLQAWHCLAQFSAFPGTD
jgi:CheY-like chemotaxis protein